MPWRQEVSVGTRPSWGDIALAAASTAATAGPLLVPTPRAWWLIALAVLASAPVAWRRLATITVCLVVGVATTVLVLALARESGVSSLLLPSGMLVCTYTFAVHSRSRWHTAGIAVLAAGVLVTLIVPRENLETDRYVITEYVAAYAVGVGVRARRAQRAAEDERAKRLAEERAGAVALERARIARDMHDIVTHSVGLMVVQAEAGPLVVRTDPARAEATFDAIAAAGRDAIGQLRLTLGALRGTGGREPQPGLDALPGLLDGARRAGLEATSTEAGARREVPVDVGVAVYRIVQESLTNTMRHAAARTVQVGLEWTDAVLTVEVADDGGGCRQVGPGHGLIGMRERAETCGGSLAIDPLGFTVTATLPLR